ncbi:MAG: hypothetical protein H6658_04410 [Ardenticatenaceae bacterium]|nr:hypothetical protein [Ardenticatenaceae bacterium]
MTPTPLPPQRKRRRSWAGLTFIIGLLLGWLAVGWWLWPVQWVNVTPAQLTPAYQEAYLTAVADSYTLTNDLAQAQARLAGWDEATLTNLLSLLEQDAPDPAARQRLTSLREALALPQVEVTMLDIILGQKVIVMSLAAAGGLLLAAVGLALYPSLQQAQARRIAQQEEEEALLAAEAEYAAANTPETAAATPDTAADTTTAAAEMDEETAVPLPSTNEETTATSDTTTPPSPPTAVDGTPQPPPTPPTTQPADPTTQPPAPRPPATPPPPEEQPQPQPLLENSDEGLQDILTNVFGDEDELNQYEVLLRDLPDIDVFTVATFANKILTNLRRQNQAHHPVNGNTTTPKEKTP